MTKILQLINSARKAIASAAAVAVAIEAYGGTPTNVKAWIATALGVIASGGVVYGVSNKPAPAAAAAASVATDPAVGNQAPTPPAAG